MRNASQGNGAGSVLELVKGGCPEVQAAVAPDLGVPFSTELAGESLKSGNQPELPEEKITYISGADAARKHIPANSGGLFAFEREEHPANVAGVISHLVADGKFVTARASSQAELGHVDAVLSELDRRGMLPDGGSFKLKVTGSPEAGFWQELRVFMDKCRDQGWPVRVTLADAGLLEQMEDSGAGLRAAHSQAQRDRGFWARLLS